MMNEVEVKKLFELSMPELSQKLYAMMPVEGEIPEKLLSKYWDKLSEEEKQAIAKQIAELLHIDAMVYSR